MNSFLQNEMPGIVTDGAFGKNVKFISFKEDNDVTGCDQYQSIVVFGTITTSDESKHHVLIKFKLRDEKMRKLMRIDQQFHNEITTYTKTIPFLLKCCGYLTTTNVNVPSLPKFFYGRNKCGEFTDNDLIVIENVIPLGYRLSEERIFLDYDHLICAIQALAKFHALSYTAKHKDAAGFRAVAGEVLEILSCVDGHFLFLNDALWKIGKRGVDRLLERGADPELGSRLRRFGELTGEPDGGGLRRALEPREPFAVMCHGDFNRNNLLFRYGGDGGRPSDALLFDFGGARYGSPALDLSFILYMNATRETRDDRWDDLLDAYCSSVAAAVPPGVRVPGRAELDAEMAASALHGFAHAAFFTPIQLDDREWIANPDKDEMADSCLLKGGETATEVVADMVQHFVDMGYA